MSWLISLVFKGPLVLGSTFVMGLVSLVVSFFDPSGRVQASLAGTWARMLLVFAGVTVRVRGLEKISPGASYVFVANHRSYFDTPVVLAHMPVQFRFLAKRGLFQIPLMGGHLRRAGHIPVSLDDPRAAVRTMSEASRIIQERGISLLIFPEGGRTEGALEPFKEGAAYIAIKAGAPLVPVGLVGVREVLPVGSMHLRGGVVEINVGDPIPTRNLSLHDRGRLTAELYSRVAELLGQPVATAK